MKLKMRGSNLIVTKEFNDPCFSGTLNAAGESRLLYHIKKLLNADPSIVNCPVGTHFIKKRMYKDGHLVCDTQQYIRTWKPVLGPDRLALTNDHWAVCGLDDDFRKGSCSLSISYI